MTWVGSPSMMEIAMYKASEMWKMNGGLFIQNTQEDNVRNAQIIATCAQHLLTARRSAIVALNGTFETLVITRLCVGARLLGGTTCALVDNVVLVDSVLLIALWYMLVS